MWIVVVVVVDMFDVWTNSDSTNYFPIRFEQSIAEATKIAKIREDLDKLDQELAVDVEILRKEIEAVSVQYTNTR